MAGKLPNTLPLLSEHTIHALEPSKIWLTLRIQFSLESGVEITSERTLQTDRRTAEEQMGVNIRTLNLKQLLAMVKKLREC